MSEGSTAQREADARWQRAACAAGAISVVFVVVDGVLQSGLPRGTASNAKIASYYASTSHWHRIEVGAVLGALSMVFFLWFLGVLRARLRAAEGSAGRVASIAFAAGVVFTALFAVLNGLRALFGVELDLSTPFRHGPLDPQLVRLVAQLGGAVYVEALIAGSVLIGATSAIALRTGVFGAWLGWGGAAIAVVVLAGSFLIPSIVVGLLLLWLLAVSAVMVAGPLTPAAIPPN